MQVNGLEGQKLARKKSLAVSVACMAIYWPTPGFKGRTWKLCVLIRWDFYFCIRSSSLWGWTNGYNRSWYFNTKQTMKSYWDGLSLSNWLSVSCQPQRGISGQTSTITSQYTFKTFFVCQTTAKSDQQAQFYWLSESLLKFLWSSLVASFSSVLFAASFFFLLLSVFRL